MSVNARILAKIKQCVLPPVAIFLCSFNKLQYSSLPTLGLVLVLLCFISGVIAPCVVVSCLKCSFSSGYRLPKGYICILCICFVSGKFWKNLSKLNAKAVALKKYTFYVLTKC